MINIAIAGACGRMGRRIIALAASDKRFRVTGALTEKKDPSMGQDAGILAGVGKLTVPITDDFDKAVSGCQVWIEFTAPFPTAVHAGQLARRGKQIGMVIGTTGFTPTETKPIQKASKKVPILMSPNMSLGVNFLFEVVADLARRLPKQFEVEILETHHRLKKDAPSGTAIQLAREVAQARGISHDSVIYGRTGQVGVRPAGQIAVFAQRIGDVVGDHTVTFGADGERLEVTHRAHSRDTFARGALEAAAFVAGRPAGLYVMRDVLSHVRKRKRS